MLIHMASIYVLHTQKNLYLPGHIRGPNPKGSETNIFGVSSLSLLHLSGKNRSGSGKSCGNYPITV